MMQEKETPRADLVEHIREQIAADPEGYANDKKMESIADKVLEDLREDA